MSPDKLVDENDPYTWVAKTKVAPVKFTKCFLFIQKNRSVFWPGNFLDDYLSQYRVDCASENCLSHR